MNIHKVDGRSFDFAGESGKEYTYLDADGIRVVVRFGQGEKTTFVDRATIYLPEHTVQVSHTEILVDGKAPAESHLVPGGWCWVQPSGVAVGANGWTIGVILDDGSGTVHKGGPLEGQLHVTVFPHPPARPEWGGLMAQGHAGVDGSQFEVK